MKVPAAAISGGWPKLPVANDPDTLGHDFPCRPAQRQLRQPVESGARAVANGAGGSRAAAWSARNSAGQGALRLAARPSLVQGTGPPIPSVAQWAAEAKAGSRQGVSDLLAQADPSWQQLIDSGWQPPDVRIDVIDVSGLLTVTRRTKSTVEHFSVAVATGSARWHPGYGSVELQNWTVTP